MPENDEKPVARKMEAAVDLKHTVVRDLDLLADAPDFARLMEEPVQAPSAYANHYLGLTVSL